MRQRKWNYTGAKKNKKIKNDREDTGWRSPTDLEKEMMREATDKLVVFIWGKRLIQKESIIISL